MKSLISAAHRPQGDRRSSSEVTIKARIRFRSWESNPPHVSSPVSHSAAFFNQKKYKRFPRSPPSSLCVRCNIAGAAGSKLHLGCCFAFSRLWEQFAGERVFTACCLCLLRVSIADRWKIRLRPSWIFALYIYEYFRFAFSF